MKSDTGSKSGLTSVIESEVKLLKRHIEVLRAVREQEPVGIIKLSEVTNHPQHMIRYSLHILEQEGVIEPSPRGAVTTGKVDKTIETLKKALADISKEIEEIIEGL